MGNENNGEKKQHSLGDYKIPENYYEHCHPNLLDLEVDQKQEYLLSGFILINSETQRWRKLVQPLLHTKYIFTPCRLVTNNYFFQQGCCSSEYSNNIDRLNIAYQPYLFSLNRQITLRKQKQTCFTQQQLWKILKYLTKALIEWHDIYPLQKIASIMPQNIIMNQKGNLRLVTQYSFPKASFFHKSRPIFQAPQDKTSSVINYGQQPNQYKILSSDLYSIGMTVLDCLILQRGQQPLFSTAWQKLNRMWSSYQKLYSRQLKKILETLLNQDYKKRPNPHDLIQLAQLSQNKFQ